ncbi:MAG: hypothetical protein JWO38_6888 [Gemmataceae bacterium]|nr:hypothetical protein [Gemmataceae bacterium]
MAKVCGSLTPAKVKSFDVSEIDTASAQLQEA